MHHVSLVAALFLLCFPLVAQRGVIHYTKEDGLISNEVNDITYDASGFLWIATNSGIDRFDGQRFIHFQSDPDDPSTICSNRITRIQFDPKGYVWAATLNGGLTRISTRTLAVRNFYYNARKKGGISDNRSTEIFVDSDGNLWTSPYCRGLDLYNSGTDQFTNYRPSKQFPSLDPRRSDLFSSIVEDRNDRHIFWCASMSGLFSFNRKTHEWKHYPVSADRFIEPVVMTGFEDHMLALDQDGKGNLYIGTGGGGLLYFDKNQALFRRFLFEDRAPTGSQRNNITDIKWRDGRYIYVCALNYEFVLFDTKTKEFIRYDKVERTIVSPFHLARYNEQIAIAGAESGLFIHNESLIFGQRIRFPFDFKDLAFGPGGKEWLACNRSNRGEVFYCNSKGEGKEYSMFRKAESEFSFSGVHYMGRNGYFLVGTDCLAQFIPGKGLVCRRDYRSSSWSPTFMEPLASFNDGDSVLWIGTRYNGLLRYSIANDRVTHHDLEAGNRARHAGIGCFARYGNTLYYGFEEGIAAIDLVTHKEVKVTFTNLLPRDQVRNLAISRKGELWAGTMANGILVINIPDNRLRKQISSRMGLQSEQTDQLLFDRNNHVWVLTPSCVAIVDRGDFSIQSLEDQHGMGGISKIIIRDNTLYFLQNKGFITSTSGSILPAINVPLPYIQRVRELNGEPFQYNKHRFDYTGNNLAFEFGVLDYSNSANNLVSYRVKGLEDIWHSGNGKDEATYFNLPGGSYAFQVKVVENGREQVASYPFRVIPPFWFRWWFIVLSLLIVGSSIWWYLRMRIRRIEMTEAMRTEFNRQINEMESKALRAQMNPHFLFNSLNSIRLFILKNEVENASDYIAKFSKLLRMILNHSRQDMITVYDEIQSLKLYLEFERLRFDKGFEFDLKIDGQQVLDSQLPPMIIQPFVENAIWHGLMPRKDDKGHIKVSFERQPDRLYVTVEDNGIGRKKAEQNNTKDSLKEGSVALQITKDRLRSLTQRTKRLNEYEVIDLMDEKGQPSGTLIKLYFETGEKL